MATDSLPTTMRIWRFSSTTNGLENNLALHTSIPLPQRRSDQHLIRVHAVSLNPVDFKPIEAPLLRWLGGVKKNSTPGFDFTGHIVSPADGSALEPGQPVYGTASTNPLSGGALAEYIVVSDATICPLDHPSAARVSLTEIAGAPIAAVTAYNSLAPYIRPGARVFINGGSGGVGTYGIQIAKALGASVTVSCSGRNAELCRSLGAGAVLDYTAAVPLLDQLRERAASADGPFDHVVDNVFNDPALYFQAHTYTTPGAVFAEVAAGPTLEFLRFAVSAYLWPAFLGGAKRKMAHVLGEITRERLEEVRMMVGEGKVRNVIDQVFPMKEAVEAVRKLKTGRARGKIVIEVAGKEL